MTATNGAGDREALRAEIQQTRAELGETVEALAAKMDVKSRVKGSAAQTRQRMQQQAGEAAHRVQQQAGEAAQRVQRQAGEAAQRVQRQAGQAAQRMQRQAGQAMASVRGSGSGLGRTVRTYRVPLAAVGAGAVAALVAVLVWRGRRR
ncbi:DUF3618 domain-containing protein [Micromonospora sp. NPDC049559]|uniref:DUF3618 domain-containing protein n=1 Tax=Micromonospora sp. NPDC049559 TaxID=3155923 RepID=UPI003442F699